MAFRYTRCMRPDSTSQSSWLSWIMHKESIHRYRLANPRVIAIESRKFWGSDPSGIPSRWCRSRFDFVVVTMFDFPQQWLRAT
jgi:hypothetical protein